VRNISGLGASPLGSLTRFHDAAAGRLAPLRYKVGEEY